MGDLGRYINTARVKRRISLRQMALDIGMSAMYLSELENGKKIPISSEILPQIAAYLEIEPEKLISLAFRDKENMVLEKQARSERIAVARSVASASPTILKQVKKLIEKDMEDR